MLDTSQVDQFATKLASSPSDIAEEGWQSEWSGRLADEMRSLAPVLTGALRASIQPNSQGVDVAAPYAAYVEYGTHDTAPQPFALPAVNKLARPAAEDAGNRILREL